MKNEQLTIIIPTIQKNTDVLNKLVSILSNDEVVKEIILIDNSIKGFKSDYSKVRVITPKKNLYVNPSWNLGVEESQTEYFALFNDDLIVCTNFCSNVMNIIAPLKEIGVIGMSEESVINTTNMEIPKETSFSIRKEKEKQPRNNNWGTIIFGKKSTYNIIPKCLKIMCGDDYLRYATWKSGLSVYSIENAIVNHLGSISSSSKEFVTMGQREIIKYAKIDREFVHTSSYEWAKRELSWSRRFLLNIFSLRNSPEKTHKIVTILGIKIKFKRNKK